MKPLPARNPVELLDVARLQRPKRVLRSHVTFNLPEALHRRLKRISMATDIEMVDIAAAALENYLAVLSAHFKLED